LGEVRRGCLVENYLQPFHGKSCFLNLRFFTFNNLFLDHLNTLKPQVSIRPKYFTINCNETHIAINDNINDQGELKYFLLKETNEIRAFSSSYITFSEEMAKRKKTYGVNGGVKVRHHLQEKKENFA
jgi:hypothetical protein